jgi:hypothetical protein
MQHGDVVRKIKQLGASDRHFLLREVREGLGIPASNRNEGARLSGIFHGLERDGVIKLVPGDRKRNRYYRVVDQERLRGLERSRPSIASGNAAAAPVGNPGDRFARIEHEIRAISDRIGQIDDKIDGLVALWS